MTVDFEQRRTSVSRFIAAPPEKIFDVLVDPTLHPVIDGSGTVTGSRTAPGERLTMGSKFGMGMKLGIPYRISNKVVEFEENRLIAWQHFGKHRWRWELEPVEGGTNVTETFDWSTSRSPAALEKAGYPTRHEANIERTLERLDAYLSHRADSL